MKIEYLFQNHNHTLIENYEIASAKYSNEYELLTMPEMKALAESDDARSNDQDFAQIYKIFNDSPSILDFVDAFYIEKSRGRNWGEFYIKLKSPFLESPVIKMLSSLKQAKADELTFEQPKLIRAWWD